MTKYLLLLLCVPSFVFGKGNVTVEPSYDLLQGNGVTFGFDGDVHLRNKLYLLPSAQLSTVKHYRDANGALDLEYRWTEIVATSVGAGYDSYHHFGDGRVESESVHTKLKIKVW